jgi:hypothetical protein
MGRSVFVVVSITLLVVLVQIGLVRLRNHVRGRLYPPAPAGGRQPPAVDATRPSRTAAPPLGVTADHGPTAARP